MSFVIGVLSSLAAAVIFSGFLWAKRHWIARELEKINWKCSGNMW